MKRQFDLIAGACAGFILLLPIVLVALAVRLTSKGPALYWSDRVGRNTSPAVATHLLSNIQSAPTVCGLKFVSNGINHLHAGSVELVWQSSLKPSNWSPRLRIYLCAYLSNKLQPYARRYP